MHRSGPKPRDSSGSRPPPAAAAAAATTSVPSRPRPGGGGGALLPSVPGGLPHLQPQPRHPAEIDLAQLRIREGMCPTCGIQLFEIKKSSSRKLLGGKNSKQQHAKRIPLDVEGLVFGGQCLKCTTGAAAAAASAAAAAMGSSDAAVPVVAASGVAGIGGGMGSAVHPATTSTLRRMPPPTGGAEAAAAAADATARARARAGHDRTSSTRSLESLELYGGGSGGGGNAPPAATQQDRDFQASLHASFQDSADFGAAMKSRGGRSVAVEDGGDEPLPDVPPVGRDFSVDDKKRQLLIEQKILMRQFEESKNSLASGGVSGRDLMMASQSSLDHAADRSGGQPHAHHDMNLSGLSGMSSSHQSSGHHQPQRSHRSIDRSGGALSGRTLSSVDERRGQNEREQQQEEIVDPRFAERMQREAAKAREADLDATAPTAAASATAASAAAGGTGDGAAADREADLARRAEHPDEDLVKEQLAILADIRRKQQQQQQQQQQAAAAVQGTGGEERQAEEHRHRESDEGRRRRRDLVRRRGSRSPPRSSPDGRLGQEVGVHQQQQLDQQARQQHQHHHQRRGRDDEGDDDGNDDHHRESSPPASAAVPREGSAPGVDSRRRVSSSSDDDDDDDRLVDLQVLGSNGAEEEEDGAAGIAAFVARPKGKARTMESWSREWGGSGGQRRQQQRQQVPSDSRQETPRSGRRQGGGDGGGVNVPLAADPRLLNMDIEFNSARDVHDGGLRAEEGGQEDSLGRRLVGDNGDGAVGEDDDGSAQRVPGRRRRRDGEDDDGHGDSDSDEDDDHHQREANARARGMRQIEAIEQQMILTRLREQGLRNGEGGGAEEAGEGGAERIGGGRRGRAGGGRGRTDRGGRGAGGEADGRGANVATGPGMDEEAIWEQRAIMREIERENRGRGSGGGRGAVGAASPTADREEAPPRRRGAHGADGGDGHGGEGGNADIPTMICVPPGHSASNLDAEQALDQFDEDLRDGCTYSGEFNSDGLRHGRGTLLWGNGDRYEGQFWNGMRHGVGTLSFADGSDYDGWWRFNRMEGHGTRRFANGNVYVGTYADGRRNGQGRHIFANGDQYVGTFKDDAMDGFGRYYFKNKESFEGTFRKGKKEGKGKYQWADGTVDIVRYSDDVRVGEGVRYSADRKKAWKLEGNKVKGKVSLEKASRLAECCGK